MLAPTKKTAATTIAGNRVICLLDWKRRHGRASAGSRLELDRAARSANKSAETPAELAFGVESTALHHSAGILSRCHHLRQDATVAPTSVAMAPGERHSPMIDRNELSSAMDRHLGQIVLNSKAKMSHDYKKPSGEDVGMADRMTETEEKLAFIRRTRLARESRFPTQGPMLTILGLDQGTYKQYETRTPLPHRFIPKFCAATGVKTDWLLTGEGNGGPVQIDIPKQIPKRQPRPGRRRAA